MVFRQVQKIIQPFLYQTFIFYAFKFSTFGFMGYLATKSLSGDYVYQNAFMLLYMSYTVGLFLAKLSLEFRKFKNISVFTLTVITLFFIQIGFVIKQNVSPYIQFFHCFMMGLFAGMGYINLVYQTYEVPSLNKPQIETALILIIFYSNMGIFV